MKPDFVSVTSHIAEEVKLFMISLRMYAATNLDVVCQLAFLFRGLMVYCLWTALIRIVHFVYTPRMNFPGTNLAYDASLTKWNMFHS